LNYVFSLHAITLLPSSVFNKATAYTLERIFTQYTSKDVVLGKEVPFGGHDDYI